MCQAPYKMLGKEMKITKRRYGCWLLGSYRSVWKDNYLSVVINIMMERTWDDI